MMISKNLQKALANALNAHVFREHCVIRGVTFPYHALSIDVREEVPRVTVTRAVTLGLFALAAKKRVARVTLQDWQLGGSVTVTVTGSDIAKVYELKNALHMEQVMALRSVR